MSMELADYLAACQVRVDNGLDGQLSGLQTNGSESRLLEAMRYSLLNGGKRIRPVLAYASAAALGAEAENIDSVACALECIHAYSLVHDDLPAMDDDQLRRGKPTCHIAFDEATAILVGDALQCLAFECIANDATLDTSIRLQLLQCLTTAAGARGMVGGQAMDLAAVDQFLDLPALQSMHALKTGALIEASVLLGAIASNGADPGQLQQLRLYAAAIGLAFQIQDDILDVVADTATLGKQQGADMARNKPTYVSLLGLDGARETARNQQQRAVAALRDFDQRANRLRQIADYIVARGH